MRGNHRGRQNEEKRRAKAGDGRQTAEGRAPRAEGGTQKCGTYHFEISACLYNLDIDCCFWISLYFWDEVIPVCSLRHTVGSIRYMVNNQMFTDGKISL